MGTTFNEHSIACSVSKPARFGMPMTWNYYYAFYPRIRYICNAHTLPRSRSRHSFFRPFDFYLLLYFLMISAYSRLTICVVRRTLDLEMGSARSFLSYFFSSSLQILNTRMKWALKDWTGPPTFSPKERIPTLGLREPAPILSIEGVLSLRWRRGPAGPSFPRTSETLTTTPHLSLRFSEAQPANLALLSLFFAEGPPPGDPF